MKTSLLLIGLFVSGLSIGRAQRWHAPTAVNPLNSDPRGSAALAQQQQIYEQDREQKERLAAQMQAEYASQLSSLNALREHLDTLKSPNGGGLFRVVNGVTNYIYDKGWTQIWGKVLQTQPDGILVTGRSDNLDCFIEGYPFQTVDEQQLSWCSAKESGRRLAYGRRRTFKIEAITFQMLPTGMKQIISEERILVPAGIFHVIRPAISRAKEARLPGRNVRQPFGHQSAQAGQQAHAGGRSGAFPARHGNHLWQPAQRNHWRWTLIFCLFSPENLPLATFLLSAKISSMSTVDLIYEKAKTLPGKLQSEALGFVEYLGRRRAAQAEAAEWQQLSRATQAMPAVQRITDADIAAEIAAYRAGK